MQASHSNRFSLWLAASGLLAAVLYLILVTGDYALEAIHAVPGEAARAEARRVASEDQPQVAAAYAQGYRQALFPSAFDAYPSLRKLSIEHGIAPLAPQPDTRLVGCNEGYGLVTYQSDRFGFRNRDALWEQSVNTVLIGDSYTFGACVEDASTIAGQLTNRAPVLNLGTSGNHPLHYAALTKTFVPRIKPKTVVLIFCSNDNGQGERNSAYYQQYFLRDARYFAPGADALRPAAALLRVYAEASALIPSVQPDAKQTSALAHAANWLRGIRPHLQLRQIRGQVERTASRFGGRGGRLPFSTALAIDTLKSVCTEANCKPLIVWIPVNPARRPDARAADYRNSIAWHAAAHGIEFYDPASALHALGSDRAYAIKGSHLSPEGYAAVASGIERMLASPRHGQ